MDKKVYQIIGIILLIIGVSLFTYIGLVSIWGDIEASFFNAALRPTEPLDTLNCPAVITQNEIGTVSASFTNPDDEPLELEIRTYITDGFVTLMKEFITDLPLDPGETKTIEWWITADDAAYERLVLVRVHQMKEFPLPYRNAACGIVVVNFPFLNGHQFIILISILGLLLSGVGITLWALNSRPIVWNRLKIFRAMLILTGTSIALAISGLLGLWGLGVILTVVWILMAIGMVYQFTTTQRRHDLEKELSKE